MDLSIIIVEYFCLNELKSCLNTIKNKIKGLSYEIIVSSNSCYGQIQQKEIKNELSGIIWISNEDNIGFAKAVNRGIKSSSGKCVLVMNADVRLLGNIISAYNYLMENSWVGMVGPKIIDKAGNLQDSCRKFMNPLEFFIRIIKRSIFKKDVLLDSRFNYNKVQSVDWIIGAFMMAKKEAIVKVSLLDEGYFFYGEDMDWCKRFWNCGYSVAYYPQVVVEYKADRKSILPLLSRNFINKHSLTHLMSYARFLTKYFLPHKK